MDAFEKAIRNAFEKGDPTNRGFREKVYRSAFAALDRTLQANPAITPDVADRRRQILLDKITEIETEFIPAVEPAVDAPDSAPSVDMEPRFDAAGDRFDAPAPPQEPDYGAYELSIGADRRGPVTPGSDDEIDAPEAEYAGYDRPARRRRSWVAVTATVAVLVAIAAVAWWAFAPVGPGQMFPRPPIDAEDFSPDTPDVPPLTLGGPSDPENWIVVFDPADPTSVSTPGDARADVLENDGERFMRITGGASGTPVLFDVGQGVLEQIAGRRAVFNIVAQADEGTQTQFSVDFSLGELGDCGRKRYAAGSTREDFLFEIDLPQVEPGAGGTIAINPDIENRGRSVDIYLIRVSSAQ